MRISNARIDGKGAFLIWSNIFVDVMDSAWLVDSKNDGLSSRIFENTDFSKISLSPFCLYYNQEFKSHEFLGKYNVFQCRIMNLSKKALFSRFLYKNHAL